ncbi:MAG: DUF2586 family protein [Bacteroidales bacterium]
MGIPKINVQLSNGALGGVVATGDGVSGLVLSGAAVTDKIDLLDPVQLFSPTGLADYGITLANNPLAWKEVQAFYEKAPAGTELWLILYAPATSLASVCDKSQASNPVKLLLDSAEGRVRLLGINKILESNYVPTLTNQIDQDVITAITNLQNLLNDYFVANKPCRALLPAQCWTGVTAGLFNPRQNTTNRVGVVMSADATYNTWANANIGETLGRAAGIQVHRNIGRVKDGSMSTTAFFTDGKAALDHEDKWNTLADYGYIFKMKYFGKNGYFFHSDPMAVAITNDYNSLSLGRTIDKAQTIAYQTYIDELNDNVLVTEEGTLDGGVIAYLEGRIENAVNQLMAGEISSFRVFISPNQNILSTKKLAVTMRIIPQGTIGEIDIELGFENPVKQ